MTIMKMLLIIGLSLLALQAGAASRVSPSVLKVWKASKDKPGAQEMTVGLVNMDELMDSAGSGCSQFTGMVKVEGLQFSVSGATLESFRFTAKDGSVWSVPTNIGGLANADRATANSFIKVGKTYFAHVQACGSGGYASLISLYDPSIAFSAFK